MGTGNSTGVLGLKSVSRQLLGSGLAWGVSRVVWLCPACRLPERREPRLPRAMAGAKTGGTMKTPAVSKHDIWSQQGQADQEMSPPAGSATSASDQLRGRGKCGKTGTDIFRASEELSSHAALNCIEDLLGPSARLPTGARNGKDGAGPGAQPSQQPGAPAGKVSAHDGESLCLSKGAVLQATCRDPAAPQCSPSTGASSLPGWQLGTASGSGQEQPPGPGVPAGQPFTASSSRHQLCPSRDTALGRTLLSCSPASWQSDRSSSCCGLDLLHI